jgi:serine/threonine-protein kinase
MLAAKLKLHPRVVVLGVGIGLPMFLVGVLSVVLLSRHPSETAGEALGEAGAAAVQARTTSAARPARASSEQIHAAATAGPSALEALSVTYPEDPAIPRAMAATLAGAGRTSDALRAVRTVAAIDPSAVDTITLAIVVGAAQRPDTADEAFALLEGPLGAPGVDGLLDVSTNKAVPAPTRTRATKDLARSDIRAKATPAAAVVLDMKGASTCSARRDWLDRAKENGDERVLAQLKAMKNPRGCGFLGIKDCWPCLRKDDSLEDTIRAVEARGPR